MNLIVTGTMLLIIGAVILIVEYFLTFLSLLEFGGVLVYIGIGSLIIGFSLIARNSAKERKLKTVRSTEEEKKRKSDLELQRIIHNSSSSSLSISIESSNSARQKKSYKYDNVKLAIPPILEINPDFNSINEGDVVTLEREPENDYDPNAIRVMLNGKKIGYLFKGTLQGMVQDYIKRGDIIYAKISYANQVDGIAIDLEFHRFNNYTSLISGSETAAYKLTGNKNPEMQENISSLSEGDEVNFYFDDEKEKYLVLSITGEIGYLPKSANSKVNDSTDGVVESIEYNDDTEKYDTIVSIQT